MRAFLTVVLVLLLGACASPPRVQAPFAGGTPVFEPMRYLEGPTRSWGVLENRDGEPTRRFRTAMLGVRDGDTLVVTQDFTFEGGRKQRRVWRIRQVDAHRYDATADDVIGTATGYAYGNSFRWEYTLELKPGNALTRVRMKHWMYLADGGETLLNRVVISRFGVHLGGTTEYFHRGAGETASIDAMR